ncbi:hypothetical protein PTTG_12004 [Puccinia triticina 1-1 BBBD Race 1]|uniref:Trehalose 6-phosphate phosphatase n=1 Tax=Puccinia triticina (isolate 1-1 / race 1 (BBBD)) TaxID=630390 RepID=A0A180GQA9_PUCT1|nr:hypothetical protein PTTG_12004 [Puccinia triticina 1-1 BBBD Race 1]
MTFHQWRARTKLALMIGCIFGPLSNICVPHSVLVHCSPMEFLKPTKPDVFPSALTGFSPQTPRKTTGTVGALEGHLLREAQPSALSPKQKVGNAQNGEELVRISRPPTLDHGKGTTVPFQSLPHQAVPSHALLEVLKKLEADLNVYVVIISGRDKAFLEETFGQYSSFHLSAEYGALWRKPGDEWDQAKDLDGKLGWKQDVKVLMDALVDKHKNLFQGRVWVEEKKTTLVLHYRELQEIKLPSKVELEGLQKVKKFLGELENNEKVKGHDLKVESDNAAIEVRMALFNKGQIAREVLESKENVGMVLCAGDSKADEDMIKVLHQMQKRNPNSIPSLTTLHVDNGKAGTDKAFHSEAQYEVKDAQEFTTLLREFYGLPRQDVQKGFSEIKLAADARHVKKLAAAKSKNAQE